MVSQRHANFLINSGGATAADLEGLGEEVRRRVYDNSGVMLEWEIERIGRPFPVMEESGLLFPREPVDDMVSSAGYSTPAFARVATQTVGG